MLYLFRHSSQPWVKFGFTDKKDAHDRLPFWTNKHPEDLCGYLGREDWSLSRTWIGSRALETVVQSLFLDRSGEFWRLEYAEDIARMVDLMAERAPTLPKPTSFNIPETAERLPCCGGQEFRCLDCGKTFPRSLKLWQHIEDVHRGTRVRCPCGEWQIPRNLKRHQNTETCKRKRAKGVMQKKSHAHDVNLKRPKACAPSRDHAQGEDSCSRVCACVCMTAIA